MFANMLNMLQNVGTGASGAASAGAFGAGGKPFLGGEGTALGGGALKEFGAGQNIGAGVNQGLEGLMAKLQGMTPEQSMRIATQMAQFAAPPAMPQAPAPQQRSPGFSSFVQPQTAAPQAAPTLRTPLMGG